MTSNDPSQNDPTVPTPKSPPAIPSQHSDVLAELEKLQTKKPGWGGAIWILLASLVIFVLAGAASWDWKFMLILVPVILFHEMGHWIAMRIFRYRNLRMFFIPLFGAAVTGQNWNVPGWKKALVSLAGPLPGIAVGLVLGILGLVRKQPLLTEVATVALFLNGLNLLPILPLDGGHVLHATLFCRNRWLDILFRVAAIVGLVLLGLFGGMRFLPYVAIALGLGLPIAFKLGEVTDRLRRMPLPPPLPDEDKIPAPTAQAIISAVKDALPANSNSKTIALHSLSVFETLNAKPPGVLATLTLLAVHGGAVFLTLVFGILLIVSRHTNLWEFVDAAARQPQHAVLCGEINTWRGAERPLTSSIPQNVIVATCARPADAATAFSQLTRQLPPAAGFTLFGDSLLLTLPAGDDAAREHWFDQLQSHATNVFVGVSNEPIGLSLTFLAPTATAATNLEQELEWYFQCGGSFHLIPPWSPEASGPAFEVGVKHRREWVRIREELSSVWTDPAVTNFMKRIDAAHRRGAASEVDRLAIEQEKVCRELQKKTLERLGAPGPDQIQPALLDLYAKIMAVNYTNRAERAALNQQLGHMLGASTMTNGIPDYGAWGGVVMRHGLLLEIRWGSFRDPSTALPALVEWLCAQKCIRIQYDFSGGLGYGADMSESEE